MLSIYCPSVFVLDSHAQIVAEKCEFMLARDDWKHESNLSLEVRTAQMSSVEGVWSSFVRDKEALLNADMQEIGWLKDIQAPNNFHGMQIKSSLNKRNVFRRWKLYCNKEKGIRDRSSIFGRKKLFLIHILKIYRLVLIGLMRDAFSRLYKARPAPFSFSLSQIKNGLNKPLYSKWGEKILSGNNDTVMILGDGAVVLNLTKSIIKKESKKIPYTRVV